MKGASLVRATLQPALATTQTGGQAGFRNWEEWVNICKITYHAEEFVGIGKQ